MVVLLLFHNELREYFSKIIIFTLIINKVKMSLSSASSYSVAGTAIKQHGVLTFVAGQTATVPCASIVATDKVVLRVATITARANPDLGLDNQFTVAITAGTGFTAVGLDATYAGTVEYCVLACGLPAVNVASA